VVDPIWNSLNDLSDMNPLLKVTFFPSIQDLENKTVDVTGGEMLMKPMTLLKMYNVLIKLKINQKDYLVLK
jgi:hypothetical protein